MFMIETEEWRLITLMMYLGELLAVFTILYAFVLRSKRWRIVEFFGRWATIPYAFVFSLKCWRIVEFSMRWAWITVSAVIMMMAFNLYLYPMLALHARDVAKATCILFLGSFAVLVLLLFRRLLLSGFKAESESASERSALGLKIVQSKFMANRFWVITIVVGVVTAIAYHVSLQK